SRREWEAAPPALPPSPARPLRPWSTMPSQVQVVLQNLARVSDGGARGGREATRAAPHGGLPRIAGGGLQGKPARGAALPGAWRLRSRPAGQFTQPIWRSS